MGTTPVTRNLKYDSTIYDWFNNPAVYAYVTDLCYHAEAPKDDQCIWLSNLITLNLPK